MATPTAAPAKVMTSIRLSSDDRAALALLARQLGTTKTDVIRQGIANVKERCGAS